MTSEGTFLEKQTIVPENKVRRVLKKQRKEGIVNVDEQQPRDGTTSGFRQQLSCSPPTHTEPYPSSLPSFGVTCACIAIIIMHSIILALAPFLFHRSAHQQRVWYLQRRPPLPLPSPPPPSPPLLLLLLPNQSHHQISLLLSLLPMQEMMTS